MVGDQDKATVPAKSEFIHRHIPQSILIYIINAGHSSTIEEPEQVNKAIDDFLDGISTDIK
jgi:3-oxoadipate enol-lactonase